jgi:hypothetical protein
VDPRGIRDASVVVVAYEAASAVHECVRWLGSVKQDIHTPLFLSLSLRSLSGRHYTVIMVNIAHRSVAADNANFLPVPNIKGAYFITFCFD